MYPCRFPTSSNLWIISASVVLLSLIAYCTVFAASYFAFAFLCASLAIFLPFLPVSPIGQRYFHSFDCNLKLRSSLRKNIFESLCIGCLPLFFKPLTLQNNLQSSMPHLSLLLRRLTPARAGNTQADRVRRRAFVQCHIRCRIFNSRSPHGE